jgi:hypothetical protein
MRTLAGLLAALLLTVAAACGGDGDSGAETEFRAQVNAVCADYGAKLALLAPPAEDVDEWAAIAADMGDLLEASVNELRLLEPPDGLSDGYAEWLGLRAELLTTMRDVQAAGGLHDDATVDSSLRQADATMTEADTLAEELGLDDCSPTRVATGTTGR